MNEKPFNFLHFKSHGRQRKAEYHFNISSVNLLKAENSFGKQKKEKLPSFEPTNWMNKNHFNFIFIA